MFSSTEGLQQLQRAVRHTPRPYVGTLILTVMSAHGALRVRDADSGNGASGRRGSLVKIFAREQSSDLSGVDLVPALMHPTDPYEQQAVVTGLDVLGRLVFTYRHARATIIRKSFDLVGYQADIPAEASLTGFKSAKFIGLSIITLRCFALGLHESQMNHVHVQLNEKLADSFSAPGSQPHVQKQYFVHQ